jgi:hypothetical protein
MAERLGRILDVVERHADSLATGNELTRARNEIRNWSEEDLAGGGAVRLVKRWLAHLDSNVILRALVRPDPALFLVPCRVLRDVVGNPFHPCVVDSRLLLWNDAVVGKLAKTIWSEGHFDHMRILADALEEAGCTDEALLAHCRQQERYFRGCWAVDALTGRS